jgi:ketosteroid isomerase-like protein
MRILPDAPAGYSAAMSQEYVDIVRRAAEWFNDRDLEALLGLFDEDAEWIEDPRYPGAETFRGPAGVERSIRKWWDAWGELAMLVDETIDLGDRVVVAGRVRARGHDSDVAVEAPFGGVYEFRDGKVIRVRVLGSREEALEAAGLPA